MVKVENSSHHKKREVMKEPAQCDLPSTMQYNSGQFWNTNKQISAEKNSASLLQALAQTSKLNRWLSLQEIMYRSETASSFCSILAVLVKSIQTPFRSTVIR